VICDEKDGIAKNENVDVRILSFFILSKVDSSRPIQYTLTEAVSLLLILLLCRKSYKVYSGYNLLLPSSTLETRIQPSDNKVE
jgi:hypothetical protein